MSLQPKTGVLIHLPSEFYNYVKLYFARPVDRDVFSDLLKLAENRGLELVRHIEEVGEVPGISEEGDPLVIRYPKLETSKAPEIQAKQIGLDAERILRKHGFEDIKIRIDGICHQYQEVNTLLREPS